VGQLQAAALGSEGMALRVGLGDGEPEIWLGAVDGDWVLRRTGVISQPVDRDSDGPAALSWSLEMAESEHGSSVTAIGWSAELVKAICLTLRPAGGWVEVTECLSSSEGGRPLTVEAFESRWHFTTTGVVREVFTPSLVPENGDLVGQHMLRAPVLVAESADTGVVLAVDIDLLRKCHGIPAGLSLLRDSDNEVDLIVGLRAQEVRGHVFHKERRVTGHLDGDTISHRYHIGLFPSPEHGASLKAARRKIWSIGQWGRAMGTLEPSAYEYARRIYPGVLDRLWRETVLGERRVGAITTNRSYDGDVWFSCWFNPLRSSYGLYHYGMAAAQEDWVEMARATRSLALSAPARSGFFPTVFEFGKDRWVDSHHQGGGPGIFHLMDMSWSMYQLVQWHRELEPDEESIARALSYAAALARVQRPDGGLPAYVDGADNPVTAVDRSVLIRDLEGGGGDPYVLDMVRSRWDEARFVESAEDGTSLLFLATLATVLPRGDKEVAGVLDAGRRIASYLAERVVPVAKWSDFEVYFSCSPKSLDFYDRRSGQWPQNTLCMQHAAAGLLSLYELTGDKEYLACAGRAMDRLSLYQQVWSPPWLGLDAFGGYGVMNTDGEWNDARQAQFAETHLEFARVTEEAEHAERAIAAARAAFTTIFLPASASRYSGWWRSPQGMAAENHGHGGWDQLNGVSGFDWGSGSALATAAHFERQGIQL
jgi:hypothetical protein